MRQSGPWSPPVSIFALGYLTRYEAAAAAGAVVVVVVVATLRATRGGLGERVRQALVDVIVVVAPLVAAVVCWAVDQLGDHRLALRAVHLHLRQPGAAADPRPGGRGEPDPDRSPGWSRPPAG